MATATPAEQELQQLAKDPSQGNDFLRLFKDIYFDNPDAEDESAVTFTRAEDAYRYFEGLMLEHSGDKAKMIKDITADLKALNGGKDISAAAKAAVENLINGSADAAEFAAKVYRDHAGILRDLTAAAGGRNVTYPGYQPYVPVLGQSGMDSFFGQLGRIFNPFMKNALEVAEHDEFVAVRDALKPDPDAATADHIIDQMVGAEVLNPLAAGSAARRDMIAKIEAVKASPEWDVRSNQEKANVMADMLREFAQSYGPDIQMKSEDVPMDIRYGTSNEYNHNGNVVFDLNPDKGFQTVAELDREREAAGLQSVGENVHSKNYFPVMSS